MCTLALAWRAFPDTPVAAAANRDEARDRPSEPPELRELVAGDAGDSHSAVTPRDVRAGGTWVGLTEHGLYVTITNRWLEDPPPADRSRGLLVEDCLRSGSAEAAVRHVEREVAHRSYDGFTLVLADDDAAYVLAWDGRLSITPLDPGVHVVTNVGGHLNGRDVFEIPPGREDAGERQRASVTGLAERLVPESGESGRRWLGRAGAALGDHDVGVCVHGDGFGTRSSSLVRTGSDPRFEYADGPPCEAAFEPVTLPANWPRPTSVRGSTEGHL